MPPASDVIHVINPLWDANGGSDWRAIEMYKALAAYYPVRLWSRFHPAPTFHQRYPVELIRPWLGRWPVGGTFIFVGAVLPHRPLVQGHLAAADDSGLQHLSARSPGQGAACGSRPGTGPRSRSFTLRRCCGDCRITPDR